MSFLHFTRSKARRPNVSDSDEGDIEPDDVAPGAATHPVLETPSFHTPVRLRDEAARGPESMSTESAGPVPVPAAPSPDEAPPSGDGPGLSGSAGPLLAGVPLRCPGSRAGPTTADSPVRGPMSSQTGMELPQYQRPRASSLMGLLQLRYEHDSSTIRARFGYNTLRDAYDSIRARYNILRGVVLSSNNEHVNSFALL